MLAFLLAMFSIVFVQTTADLLVTNRDVEPTTRDGLADLFPSVQGGMMTLLQAVSGGDDWANGYHLLKEVGIFSAVLYVFVILFFMISVWNVVTSLFIEKAMTAAQPDLNHLMYEQQMADLRYAEELTEMTQALDTDRSGTISFEEFLQYFKNEKYRSFFIARGIEVKDAQKFFQILSGISGTNEVDCDSFVQGCLRMKGLASSLDLQTIRFECKVIHAFCKDQFSQLRRELDLSRQNQVGPGLQAAHAHRRHEALVQDGKKASEFQASLTKARL
jgi:hypothetical protein